MRVCEPLDAAGGVVDGVVGELDGTAEACAAGEHEAAAADAAGGQHYRVIVRCRNRFHEGEVLGLLSPDLQVKEIEIRDLAELFVKQGADVAAPSPSPIDELPCESLADYDQVSVEVANKGMHLYAITTSIALRPRDILRSTRIDPSKKN